MSKYTIDIKTLIKNGFDFGLQNYPIFDESYRETLNSHILNYYLTDEIGFETEELFKIQLNLKMDLIMPKYNAIYNAQKEMIDSGSIAGNVNLNEQSSTNANAISNSESTGRNVFQDTPQGRITQQEIDSETYASNVSQNKTNINDNTNSATDYIRKIIGNNGNKYNSEAISLLAQNFANIDIMIIEELHDLFFGLY